MDRDKVFDAFRNCITEPKCRDCPWETCEEFHQTKKIPLDLCLDILKLLKEQGWHLLTEDDDGFIHGLPGDDGQYLMTDGKEIWIDDYVDGVDDGVWLDSGRDVREIKAWMSKRRRNYTRYVASFIGCNYKTDRTR